MCLRVRITILYPLDAENERWGVLCALGPSREPFLKGIGCLVSVLGAIGNSSNSWDSKHGDGVPRMVLVKRGGVMGSTGACGYGSSFLEMGILCP